MTPENWLLHAVWMSIGKGCVQSRLVHSQAERAQDSEVNPVPEIGRMIDVIGEHILGLFPSGKRLPVVVNIGIRTTSFAGDALRGCGIVGHVVRAELPPGVRREGGIKNDFGLCFSANEGYHLLEVLLELRRGHTPDIVVIHPKSYQHEIGMLI